MNAVAVQFLHLKRVIVVVYFSQIAGESNKMGIPRVTWNPFVMLEARNIYDLFLTVVVSGFNDIVLVS